MSGLEHIQYFNEPNRLPPFVNGHRVPIHYDANLNRETSNSIVRVYAVYQKQAQGELTRQETRWDAVGYTYENPEDGWFIFLGTNKSWLVGAVVVNPDDLRSIRTIGYNPERIVVDRESDVEDVRTKPEHICVCTDEPLVQTEVKAWYDRQGRLRSLRVHKSIDELEYTGELEFAVKQMSRKGFVYTGAFIDTELEEAYRYPFQKFNGKGWDGVFMGDDGPEVELCVEEDKDELLIIVYSGESGELYVKISVPMKLDLSHVRRYLESVHADPQDSGSSEGSIGAMISMCEALFNQNDE